MLSKFITLITNPARVIDYIYHRRKYHAEIKERALLKTVNRFEEMDTGLLKRRYQTFEDYINHQCSRPKPTDEEMVEAYKNRLDYFKEEHAKVINVEADKGKSILCLGARDGAEVEAFRHYGMLAVGMDISFQEQNEYVHFGDFHNVPYPNDIFDYVYMNTLNHALDPKQVIEEVRRVLKPKGGVFIIDLRYGVEENAVLEGRHHSIAWKTQNQATDMIELVGFTQVYDDHLKRKPFCRYKYEIT